MSPYFRERSVIRRVRAKGLLSGIMLAMLAFFALSLHRCESVIAQGGASDLASHHAVPNVQRGSADHGTVIRCRSESESRSSVGSAVVPLRCRVSPETRLPPALALLATPIGPGAAVLPRALTASASERSPADQKNIRLLI